MPQTRPSNRADFIIVGGGTAGLCLAGRLAENFSGSIVVLEVGKGYVYFMSFESIDADAVSSDPLSVENIAAPGLGFSLVESEYDWAYRASIVDRPDYHRIEDHMTRCWEEAKSQLSNLDER